MARMRTIKPEAATSESLAEVDRAVRWTFAVFWTHCDDEGRAVWNPRLLRAALYPLDDAVTLAVLDDDFDQLERVGAVCRYEVAGRLYVHVPAWAEHQHPNRKLDSKLPPCPKTDHSVPAHAQRTEGSVSTPGGLTSVVVEERLVEGEGEGVGRPNGRTPRGARLPENWTPSIDTREWTVNQIGQRAVVELEKFRNYWLSKSGKDAAKLDWDRTWRNWVLTAAEQHGRASPNGGSITDERTGQAHNVADQFRREQAHARRELPA